MAPVPAGGAALAPMRNLTLNRPMSGWRETATGWGR